MGVISGILGAVNGVNAARNWSISYTGELQDVAHSGTRGATGGAPGNTDWSGSMAGYGHTPPAMPGEAFAFVGSMDGAKGASGTAILDQVVINADVENRRPIDWTANFSANGALTLGAAVAADTSLIVPPPANEHCIVSLGTLVASPEWTTLHVRNWALTVTSGNQAYVDTSTAGSKRRKKGNIGLSFSIGVYTDDLSALPKPNDVKALRFYVSQTEFWEVYWGIFGELSNVQVDRETATIVGASLTGRLRTIETIADAGTLGHITKPSTVVWWPAA